MEMQEMQRFGDFFSLRAKFWILEVEENNVLYQTTQLVLLVLHRRHWRLVELDDITHLKQT